MLQSSLLVFKTISRSDLFYHHHSAESPSFPCYCHIYIHVSLLKCPFHFLTFHIFKRRYFSHFSSLSWYPFLRKITSKNASKSHELLINSSLATSEQAGTNLGWRRCGPLNNNRVLFYLLFHVIFWSLNFGDFKIVRWFDICCCSNQILNQISNFYNDFKSDEITEILFRSRFLSHQIKSSNTLDTCSTDTSCIHLYPDTSCSYGLLVSGVNAA